MQKELTAEQTSRQDFVDDEIHALINKLVPEKYMGGTIGEFTVDGGNTFEVETIPWNIAAIGVVRAAIEAAIYDYGVGGIDLYEEEFSMAFYPYLEDPCDFCWGYGFAWALMVRQGVDCREIQKCDSCGMYLSDEAARRAATNYNFTDAYKWDQMVLEKGR